MERKYVDVTQPTENIRRFNMVLALFTAIVSPIACALLSIGAIRIGSEGGNPGGAIFFAVTCLLLTVFGVVRFRSHRSGRYGANPDSKESARR